VIKAAPATVAPDQVRTRTAGNTQIGFRTDFLDHRAYDQIAVGNTLPNA